MKRHIGNLIGLILLILGVVLTLLTDLAPFMYASIIGALLFVSFPGEAMFCDYIIANSNAALFRKRYYIDCLVFTLISLILTLGKAKLRIVWKEEYFKAAVTPDKGTVPVKISRKEYIALRNEQRTIYSTQVLSREFMERSYTEAGIGFRRKKTRLIAAGILAGFLLTMLAMPDGFYCALVCEAFVLPMVILWISEYKDAKILQQAYDKALNRTITAG